MNSTGINNSLITLVNDKHVDNCRKEILTFVNYGSIVNKRQKSNTAATQHSNNIICSEVNIGIKHGFSRINIRQVPWEVLKTEAEGCGFQHLQRDLANVNALKNHV